jgi:excisionase family DNA binding protein
MELIHAVIQRTPSGAMGLVTTKEAAQILGVTPARVRQFIKDGRLAAEKRGRDHLLGEQEVKRFKRHGRRSGPKGGRPRRDRS